MAADNHGEIIAFCSHRSFATLANFQMLSEVQQYDGTQTTKIEDNNVAVVVDLLNEATHPTFSGLCNQH